MYINHFSNYKNGNASEYIKPGGVIDITSHGIGSGIYGVSDQCVKKSPPSQYRFSGTFQIKNPYTLVTTENCDDYIEISKTMMRRLDRIDNESREPDFSRLAESISGMVAEYGLPKLDYIEDALSLFWKDYKGRIDIVELPINYVLKKNGYDGVCSTPGTFCDRWCKGYVKFIPYPGEGDIVVGMILNRQGITKEEFVVGDGL